MHEFSDRIDIVSSLLKRYTEFDEEEEGFTLDELVEIKILWNRAHDNPENDYYNLYLNEFSDDDVKVA